MWTLRYYIHNHFPCQLPIDSKRDFTYLFSYKKTCSRLSFLLTMNYIIIYILIYKSKNWGRSWLPGIIETWLPTFWFESSHHYHFCIQSITTIQLIINLYNLQFCISSLAQWYIQTDIFIWYFRRRKKIVPTNQIYKW